MCRKPKGKCADCEHRELLPVTDQVIFDHLAGKITAGVYPLLHDDTCFFLAVDFDKKCWQDDVRAFLATCEKHDLPAALERSRSGNGGHVWFFFEKALDAALARNFGCTLLTETLAGRSQIGLDSYDRLFPSQDTLSKKGFGNLIALPLQKKPRAQGNSIFLDENFEPYPEQWQYLASILKW